MNICNNAHKIQKRLKINEAIYLILLTTIFIGKSFELIGQENKKEMSHNKRYLEYCFENIRIVKDVPFGKALNHSGIKENLALDIYIPENDQLSKRRLIIWFHGGGFKPGNDKTQRYIVNLSNAFARKGYVCIAPNYRLRTSPSDDWTGTINDAIDDVELALNWIHEHYREYGIDPEYIIVGGGSAGGILMCNFFFRNNSISKKWNLNAFIDLWGSPDNLPSDKADYIYAPPSIIIHGTNDTIVSYKNSVNLASNITKAGVYCELHPFKGAAHTPVNRMDEIISLVTTFLCRPDIESNCRN
jgi:acetyl esterase/lipase